MTTVAFGRLEDLALRDAWTNEARDFTPWLAENIDHIAEAIGLSLELTGQEVRVESFAADILARNTADDSLVLIENQLEQTDHTHLGQIMTYLAGLEARTVVWIAPAFREPHLSAIRWLNEHTADGFAFFAVRLRVVRIGDSPYAPVFEVVEKPDNWSREVRNEANITDLKPLRGAYFNQVEAALSDLEIERKGQHIVFSLGDGTSFDAFVEINRKRACIFVRPHNDMQFGELEAALRDAHPNIEERLGPIRETRWGGALFSSIGCSLDDETSWPETLAWHKDKVHAYVRAFAEREPGDA